ncbi:MAG: hypothetical protein JXA28_01530 [Bacteroidetes bacterium]|nr:hypothetical protein [Bacteroidota bacterium]
MKNETGREPFAFKDCTLAAIATGKRAQNLRELRDHLMHVDTGCIYYHFWGGRLRPQFDEPEFNNDFAAWCKHALRDDIVAERLSVVDPTGFASMEDLRNEVIEILEERLYEREFIPWAKTDEQFSLIRSQIVVFATPHTISEPEQLPEIIPHVSTSSIFYHFIDARRRTPDRKDDFSTWLEGLNGKHAKLLARLADVDPYFVTLSDLRGQLTGLFTEYFAHEHTEGRL